MEEGLVIRIEPRVWTVEIGDRELPCTLKPRLFELDTGEKNPVAVGDRVMVRVEGDHGVIEEMLPRKNRLARPKPNDPSTLQVTAANVDTLVVVVATKDPPLRLGLIDRFLVAAERQGMEAVIVVNKCDRGRPEAAKEKLSLYPALGYPVLLTTATTGAGVPELAEHLGEDTALFVGHSGVGKSTLMNALAPGLDLRTGKVARHGRGRHTTTAVTLWRHPGGGHLVDSPGIRGFGLTDIPAPELAILMPDLRPYTSDCRYPDCTHWHEPDCGVKVARDEGRVDPNRYDSYVRMLKGILGEEDEEEEAEI